MHRQLRLQPHDKVPAFGKLVPVRDELPKEDAIKIRRKFPSLLLEVQKYSSQSENMQKTFQTERKLGSFHPSIAPRINPPMVPGENSQPPEVED